MSKKRKKSIPVQMKQEEQPLIIDMKELVSKRSGVPKLFFRTGKYKTEKDRPRDKSYKKRDYDI